MAKRFSPSAQIDADARAYLERAKQKQDRSHRELKAAVRVLDEQLEFANAKVELLLALDAIGDHVMIAGKKKSGSNEATSFSLATDWHVEESIPKAKVSGLNHYTLRIAEQSIERFFTATVELIRLNRMGRDIRQHVLALGGDFFSGHIHEDLVETTSLSPTQAVYWLEERISAGIRHLLEHADLEKLIVPCVVGNHGRTTMKRRISTSVEHSYEWLMYSHLARLFAPESRVEFKIADGYHLWIDVAGYRVRFHHGDEVRFNGGVGGVMIPLNKAIASWNTARRADLDILGHHHTLFWGPASVVNGSLIGYTPFGVAVKGAFERPMQAFFLIDHAWRARTMATPIFVR